MTLLKFTTFTDPNIIISHLIMNKNSVLKLGVSFLCGLLGCFAIKAATTKVVIVDADSSSPLPAASVFSKGGAMLGITEDDGSFDRATPSDYPLTIRYLGYEAASFPEVSDTLRLSPVSLPLSEVEVTDNMAGIHLVCYIRTFVSDLVEGDTVTIFSERMVDYLLPLRKSKGFKKMESPRQLRYRFSSRFKCKDGTDSVSRKIRESDYAWVLPGHLYDSMDVLEEPESLQDVSYGEDSVKLSKYVQRVFKGGGNLTFNNDPLRDHKDHVWSPNMLKLLGMTIDIYEMEINDTYPINPSGKYRIYDLAMRSVAFGGKAKGKMLKWVLGTSEPFDIYSLMEIYPVDCTFITPEESQELKKTAPEIEWRIPEIVPPLDAATLDMVSRCDSLPIPK